jgi:CheY-like chemotaxis protein
MSHLILVVEDNPANSELLSDWLDIEGFSVEAAETLAQAFRAIGKRRFDAILLDVQLGVEDGLDLARWIRQDPELHNTPVIAVTAHAMVTDQARVLQAGCNACISKPIDFQLLRRQLDGYLPEAPGQI